ncbi:DnaJ domain-containing protein [Synechococcus sp. M16CYN]|uniref:DnaJ domain-containing protein n=1 Tax=Synechococcus sp. M16CYN TaxID=3103139 RepID=UPI00333F6FC8
MTSTADPDYWSLLGIQPDSDADQLKRAFRREARRWHPDLNGDDPSAEERFKLINEAYVVLNDPQRRDAWQKGRGVIAANSDCFSNGFPDFDEYLDVIFGTQKRCNQPEPAASFFDQENNFQSSEPTAAVSPPPPPVRAVEDLESLVELTPDQALLGTQVELTLGDGTIIQLNTPPLAGDGWRLRLADVAPGGRDHFLQLRVVTGEGLRVDGLCIHYRLELFPPDAVLGCAVDVPTLEGPVTLQVPPGSSSGRLLRLRGRGLGFNNQQGDQLVEIVVVIPADLGEAERALYRRLQELALESEM